MRTLKTLMTLAAFTAAIAGFTQASYANYNGSRTQHCIDIKEPYPSGIGYHWRRYCYYD